MLCSTCNKNPPKKKRRQCSTCLSRIYRHNNRVKYAYDTLRSNAKRRGHGFELTLEQFEKFAIATDYIINKGNRQQL